MHPSLADEPAIKARNRIVSRAMFFIVELLCEVLVFRIVCDGSCGLV